LQFNVRRGSRLGQPCIPGLCPLNRPQEVISRRKPLP
jgi:hypothetical protein